MLNLLYRKTMYKILMFIYRGNTQKGIDIILKYDPLNILTLKDETYAEFEKRLIRRDIILVSIAFILPFGFPIALYWLY
jgi:hypothetical protein